MKIKPITGRIPKGKRQPIFSRASRACQHATFSLCQPTLGGSMAKRCCTNLIHTIGHRKNLPTSEVTQWHEQSTRVTFRCSSGEGTVLTITTIGAGDNHQPPLNDPRCSKPSRWRQPSRVTSESRSETRTPSVSRCKHSSNALGFTPNLTRCWIYDRDEWEGFG